MVIDVKKTNSVLYPYNPRKLALFEVHYMIRVPEEHLKSVVFLCVDKENNEGKTIRTPSATGFYVRVPLSKDAWVVYLVTARHCIDEARQYGKLYVRTNLKTGVYEDAETIPESWHAHPSADVSAIPISSIKLPDSVKPQDLDQRSVAIESFVGSRPHYDYEAKISNAETIRIRPDVGHQVFFVGLFTQHYGRERNLPIARFGHISRMPAKVKMKLPGNIDFEGIAYLVECQAWGGNSGAPVFFLYPFLSLDRLKLPSKVGVVTNAMLLWHCGLLGLVNGHYPVREKAEKTGDISEVEMDLNSGIAIVTPAEAIRQLLMEDEELIEQNEEPS